MKKLPQFLRFFFLSPEFIVILLSIITYLYLSGYLISFSMLVSKKSELIKHLALVPSGITVWVFIKGKKLLFPEKDKKGILQNWPNYWKLRIGFEVALIYSFIFSVIGIIGWTQDWIITNPKPILFLLSAIIGELVVFYTVYKAEIKINEIFAQRNDHK